MLGIVFERLDPPLGLVLVGASKFHHLLGRCALAWFGGQAPFFEHLLGDTCCRWFFRRYFFFGFWPFARRWTLSAIATACFCGLPADISVRMFSDTAFLLLDFLSGILFSLQLIPNRLQMRPNRLPDGRGHLLRPRLEVVPHFLQVRLPVLQDVGQRPAPQLIQHFLRDELA